MIPENLIALAKVIRITKRFDMGVIVGRYDPELDEVLVEPENPDHHEFWSDPTLMGDYCAWANALSEHVQMDDEDHAAAWLGLTLVEFDQLSYVCDEEQAPSLWTRQRKHYKLELGHHGVQSGEITPEMAADMLERLVRGEVKFYGQV